MPHNFEGVDVPADTYVPDLLPSQIRRLTLQTLRAKPARNFDPHAALCALRTGGDRNIVAVDIGGDKAITASYSSRGGRLVQTAEAVVRQCDGGSKYLHLLEQVAEIADKNMLSVAISYAGPTDGTRIVAGPNLPAFMAEFHDRYGGDFQNLFPSVVVANDAEAGMIAGALEVTKRYPGTKNIVYIINGSGLGGAILTENTIYATEPGHIEIESSLNPFNQQKSCGVLGACYVCLEVVAASKAGIEDIWLQKTGERLRGREIARRRLSKDQLALSLYENSALVTAHAVEGLAQAFNIADSFDETVVVGHGGTFHVSGYGESVKRVLAKTHSCTPKMIFTKNFSVNACLDGAAIVAMLGDSVES